MGKFDLPDVDIHGETPKERAAEFVRNAKKDKKLWLPILATAAEIIALLALMGLLTLITADFVIKDISIFGFLIMATMRIAAVFLGKDVSARARVNMSYTEKEYKDLLDKYKKEIEDIDYAQFEKYLNEVENPRRKIAAYSALITPKIKKATAKVAELNITLGVLEKKRERNARKIAAIKNNIEKQKSLIEKYSELISDKYIADNFKYIKVKYERLTVGAFVSATREDDHVVERATVNREWEIKKGIMKGLPITFLICAYLAIIGFENVQYGSVDILGLVADVLLLSFYFLQGWFSVGSRVVDMTRDALIFRTAFVQRYKQMKNNN